jgi:hypothetical protein
MATDDQSDFVGRLRAALPAGWFPVTGSTDAASSTPVLDAVIAGLASTWASLFSSLQFVANQARVGTASAVWLDVAARDFFGLGLPRKASEADSGYAARIKANLLRPETTRHAMAVNLTALTGRAPVIVEPARPADTGGYSRGGAGYSTAGVYGSLALPFQIFITVYRPTNGGVANVGGYYLGASWAGGGYGVGAIEYATPSMIQGAVTDADILATINTTKPAGSLVWARITN